MARNRPREIVVPPLLWRDVREMASEMEISAAEFTRRAQRFYIKHLRAQAAARASKTPPLGA